MLLVEGGSRKDNKKRCPKLLGNSRMVMSFLVWLGIIASKRTFLRHFTTALLKYVKSTWCEGRKDLQLLVKLGPSLSHYQAGIWTLESPFSLAGLATLFLVICLPHRGLFISVTVTPRAWNGPVLTTFWSSRWSLLYQFCWQVWMKSCCSLTAFLFLALWRCRQGQSFPGLLSIMALYFLIHQIETLNPISHLA